MERIARLLGHTISMQSRVGHGSRFSVTLPIASQQDSLPDKLVQRVAAGPTSIIQKPLRVLVIEDDLVIQQAMHSFLSGFGHKAFLMRTSQEALGFGSEFDVALVDFNLALADGLSSPEPTANMYGLEIIDELAKQKPGARFALITASLDPSIGARAAAQHVPVLAKPVDPYVLERWLHT
ncbi:hypothetical protein PsB1_2068 [Candidatus Phycosocius spiralis]|uniref:Response regulatory domain-containing protein n=1 Tax=Candidatus Phycosocius spiralis TaxID=2815099 RepID=A0ABQ4PZ14_9PROT|nr:hypothetical protein PsB1_2068 [Candidatus Phycosocius spiralis]